MIVRAGIFAASCLLIASSAFGQAPAGPPASAPPAGAPPAGAQPSGGQPTWQQRAAAAQAANDLPGAIAIVRPITAAQPTLVPAWLQLGRLYRLAGNLDGARDAFGKVLAINPTQPAALLGMAVVETQAGKLDRANELLAQAVAAGILPGQIDAVRELEPLRQTAAYKASYDQASRAANPCRHQPESSQFDFWVGDWDVFVNGQLIARNIITKEMNGCIIHERYQITSGLIWGESINYYDAFEKKWRQNWVSSSNNVITLAGKSPRPGVMELEGTSTAAGSPVQLQRATWTREQDGGVTQSVSVSNDNGATWSSGFVGRYVRSNRPTKTMYPDDKYPENAALSASPRDPS